MPADTFKSVKDLLDEKVGAEGRGDDDDDAAPAKPAPGITKREKQFNSAFRAASGPLAKNNWRSGC